MAKLTGAQITSIETVLYHMGRAQKLLNDDCVIVGRTKVKQTTTEDFARADGLALQPIAKDIGSDLVGFEMAAEYLRNFLKFNTK